MIPITIEEFSEKYIEWNEEEKLEEVKMRFKSVLIRKLDGGKCQVCGSPIWAYGSALSEFDGCFTCITGENDDSEDYEFVVTYTLSTTR